LLKGRVCNRWYFRPEMSLLKFQAVRVLPAAAPQVWPLIDGKVGFCGGK